MIHLVCARGEENTIGRFIRGMPGLGATIRVITYDTLVSRRAAPIAHYIFTNHDLLTPGALEWAAGFAEAASAADPAVRILNHPLLALERYGLIRRLAQMGIGAFDVVRLDEGRMPRFPAFIRRETGTGRPETGLLHSEAEYASALAALDAAGKARRGRVAMGYVDVRSPDGHYRKFGVVRIGDRLVPQHLFVADDWCVKGEDARFNEETAAEELAFVMGDLPTAELISVFEAARIEYGRVDYALLNGRPVIFEINTNPSLPRPGGGDLRADRRARVCRQIADALRAIDTPLTRSGQFRLPRALQRPTRATVLREWLRSVAIRTSLADAYFRWRRNRRSSSLPLMGGDGPGGRAPI